jgi:glycine hydroxymethyltransferase
VKNAKRLAERLVEHGFRVVSGGTDNHVFLLDVAKSGLTGKVAEKALEGAGVTVNKNTIPFDPNPPMVASGIRIGTPALTTRDMKETEMEKVGDFIAEVLRAPEDEGVRASVRAKVRELCERFPLYDPLM